MSRSEVKRIITFSWAVRQSSLKRLQKVKNGLQNWRPTAKAMSFAEIAQHIIDADNWMLKKLSAKKVKSMRGKTNPSTSVSYVEFRALLQELRESGEKRKIFLRSLSSNRWSEQIFDDRYGGYVEVWWVIVRGNLDHEIHHRGQIATYLRILDCQSKS